MMEGNVPFTTHFLTAHRICRDGCVGSARHSSDGNASEQQHPPAGTAIVMHCAWLRQLLLLCAELRQTATKLVSQNIRRQSEVKKDDEFLRNTNTREVGGEGGGGIGGVLI